MGLPPIPLPTRTVEVAGEKVEIRCLSRAQVLRIATFHGDPDAAENWILACGAAVTEDEARAWRESVPGDNADVGGLIDAICELSGLLEGAQKSG